MCEEEIRALLIVNGDDHGKISIRLLQDLDEEGLIMLCSTVRDSCLTANGHKYIEQHKRNTTGICLDESGLAFMFRDTLRESALKNECYMQGRRRVSEQHYMEMEKRWSD